MNLQRSQTMVFRRIADESLLVPIVRNGVDMNAVYVLNPVGCHIWELLDGQRTLDEIAGIITHEFVVEQAEAKRDLLEFVAQLADINAVVEVGS